VEDPNKLTKKKRGSDVRGGKILGQDCLKKEMRLSEKRRNVTCSRKSLSPGASEKKRRPPSKKETNPMKKGNGRKGETGGEGHILSRAFKEKKKEQKGERKGGQSGTQK